MVKFQLANFVRIFEKLWVFTCVLLEASIPSCPPPLLGCCQDPLPLGHHHYHFAAPAKMLYHHHSDAAKILLELCAITETVFLLYRHHHHLAVAAFCCGTNLYPNYENYSCCQCHDYSPSLEVVDDELVVYLSSLS
ncbi:hypothetical protein ACH5RR_018541 [Cinchona calisaya]|uniref:Secreted protein n=1 Tax=Cinchona calisaya TaxID=153742 RepID=A0ABD2ZLS4_9GENT